MNCSIAITSGKGGTGKTFISTNIARVLAKEGEKVTYLDCDVEEPNGHLFLEPKTEKNGPVFILSPMAIDTEKCNACGECVNACNYNALALINGSVLFFKNLCHVCGGCTLVCPTGAIIEKERKIGDMVSGTSGEMDVHYAHLETGEYGMTPRLIKKVKENAGSGINILDSPPGTACPVVETVKDADLCVLVTDPTPFGVNDLKLAVIMCREIGKEPVVVVNRAEYLDTDLNNYLREENLIIAGEIPDKREIAEWYSDGHLVVDKSPEYESLFRSIAHRILEIARKGTTVPAQPAGIKKQDSTRGKTETVSPVIQNVPANGKEVVVISGKGGTGKTSLTAAFCALEAPLAISDCDVDAADLHLVLRPEIMDQGAFSGGVMAEIDDQACTGCGLCADSCRFDAIRAVNENGRTTYRIDPVSCEGCRVCGLVCKFGAIAFHPAVNGEWFVSETRFGPMSHAKLQPSEENSGKLVTLVRNMKNKLAAERELNYSIIDGSPGTGCPVTASITGTDYAVIVTEPTVSGIHDLERVLDVAAFFGIRSGIIVNKCDLNRRKTDEIREIAQTRGSDFLGEIPYDKAFTIAQMEGLSIVEYTDNGTTAEIKTIRERLYNTVFGE